MKTGHLKKLCLFALTAGAYTKCSTLMAYADPSVISGIVTADVLNVRSNPSMASSVVGTLYESSRVDIVGEQDNWYKINFQGSSAWISKDFISVNGNNNGSSSSKSDGQVVADMLNVRSGPSTGHAIKGSLYNGDKVSILESNNGWHRIEFKGNDGWVSSDYIVKYGDSNSDTSTSYNKKVQITADMLNVRSGPGTSYSVVSSLYYGNIVQASESRAGWLKISSNGVEGWISSDYSTDVNGDNNNSGSNNGGNTAINKVGQVTVNSLNFRTGPNTSSSVISVLSKGTKINVLSEENGWYKVDFNGSTGYVSKDYVTFDVNDSNTTTPGNPGTSDEESLVGKVGVVNAASVNLRSGAGTQYGIIKVLNKGSKVDVKSSSNGWYKVSSNETVGWMSSDYLDLYNENDVPTNPGNTNNPLVGETPLVTANGSGQDISNFSKKFLGVPYVWGGSSPSGFDCSGLIQYCYNSFGVYLPRVTYDQVNIGKVVDRSNLQPGDLIFFDTGDGSTDIGHIGMYVGDNQFIHAPKPGDVVKISSLSNSYYSSHYYVAKRIVN